MEQNFEEILVSVPVITYNSSKYVLETLESIKAQTYQNIELIVSDDCSTDNTVKICRKWIDENKERFVRTKLITSEINTGVSANLNRAEAECSGEWVKGIAGDDLLMPNCVELFVSHIKGRENVVYIFGRIKAFGATKEINRQFEEQVFDYSFFEMTIKEQYNRLIFGDNCIPAATCFYNRKKSIELGLANDERIPLLEDWPKWIKVLEKGITMEFLDKYVVNYRIHSESLSTTSNPSLMYIKSMKLFNFYYRFPIWYKNDSEYALNWMVKEYLEIYERFIKIERECESIKKSYAYRIGLKIITPIKKIKKKLCNK